MCTPNIQLVKVVTHRNRTFKKIKHEWQRVSLSPKLQKNKNRTLENDLKRTKKFFWNYLPSNCHKTPTAQVLQNKKMKLENTLFKKELKKMFSKVATVRRKWEMMKKYIQFSIFIVTQQINM